MYSVLILTKNEERTLGDAIASVESDDIWVLDSFSSDRTLEIAEKLGCRIEEKEFSGYASQRNAGMSLPFKYDWVLMLDADERLSEDCREVLNTVSKDAYSPYVGITFRRKDYFLGRWLKGASGYPSQFPRAFKVGCCKVSREINEQYEFDGPVLNTPAALDHFPFINGAAHWSVKHVQYALREAEISFAERCEPIVWGAVLSDRAQAKRLLSRLPLRPRGWGFPAFLFKGNAARLADAGDDEREAQHGNRDTD